MALNGAAKHPRACQALSSMMCRNELNPADVTVVSRKGDGREGVEGEGVEGEGVEEGGVEKRRGVWE